jgi:hypothetical protein
VATIGANTARGVLRRAVCLSLERVLQGVMAPTTAAGTADWARFGSSPLATSQFWPAYAGAAVGVCV